MAEARAIAASGATVAAGPLPAGAAVGSSWAERLGRAWPLIALTLFAAALRLSTIGLQSFWFDEAFTPVHVIHPSIVATMETMAHTENSPPLWYVTIWGWTRIFGTGVVAMRIPSALVGIALVPVAWAIGKELSGARAAVAAAALAACNPLLVWYSQEARTYEMYALMGALAVLCFVRAEKQPTGRRMAAFALSGILALMSHYFAVFLLVPMALWLLRKRERWRVAIPAVGAIAIVGVALIPLLLSQGGHGTQWIGKWPLKSRLEAIPQYYLTGESGQPLGHGVELLVALPLIAGLAWGLLRRLERSERQGALMTLALSACGVLIPIAFVAIGYDYLAPRNLIAAMVPVTVLLGIVLCSRRAGRVGIALTALAALAFLAICIDVNLSPRLQRGDWSGVAAMLSEPLPKGAPAPGAQASHAPAPGAQASHAPAPGASPSGASRARPGLVLRAMGPSRQRVIVTVHLGSAPLEYYMPGMQGLHSGEVLDAAEIDEVGYPPFSPSAGAPPTPAFKLIATRDVNGLRVYRFLAPSPQQVTVGALRHEGLTSEVADVLGRVEKGSAT